MVTLVRIAWWQRGVSRWETHFSGETKNTADRLERFW